MYMICKHCTAIVEPWELSSLKTAAGQPAPAIEQLIGTIGLILLAIAMLCGIVSGLNAFYLAGSRLLYSMAIAEAIPAPFGKLDPKYKVPRFGHHVHDDPCHHRAILWPPGAQLAR